MKPIHRIAIDEHLAAAAAPGELPGLSGPVRALPSLKALAVALDQVINRSQDDLRRWGAIDLGTAKANAEDFAACLGQLRVLELGLIAGRAMLEAVARQVNPLAEPVAAPTPEPFSDPKPPGEPAPEPTPAPAPKDRRGK